LQKTTLFLSTKSRRVSGGETDPSFPRELAELQKLSWADRMTRDEEEPTNRSKTIHGGISTDDHGDAGRVRWRGRQFGSRHDPDSRRWFCGSGRRQSHQDLASFEPEKSGDCFF
jgi:hypothetical protein